MIKRFNLTVQIDDLLLLPLFRILSEKEKYALAATNYRAVISFFVQNQNKGVDTR